MMSALEDEEDKDLYLGNYDDYPSIFRDMKNNLRRDNFTGKIDADENSLTIFRITATILIRVGFLLVQIGSVPVGNVNLILLQNIIDFCTVTAISILVGFTVAFTGDIAGLIGEGVWIGDGKANVNEALIAWGAAATASAICTSCIVGRTHAAGYLLTGIIISGIVQPLLVHWAWTPRGWMADNVLAGTPVSFKDYAGGGTIHAVGGIAGFLGCATLGRRILKLRDIDDASLPSSSSGMSFAGYFFILLGLQGFGMPIAGRRGPRNAMSKILTNNLLAASSSSLLIVALHFALSREPFNYWTVMRCVQGSISGIVAVASGLDVCSPLATVGISCSSGLLFYLVSRRIYRSALEDYCNIVAVHLTSALFGSLVAPLCDRGNEGSDEDAVSHTMVLDVAWQVICILALLFFVTAAMGTLFALLELSGFLRNRSEFVNHTRATVALERGPPRSYMQRLFFPGVESLYLQPGSMTKSDKGPQIMSPRLWRYEQELTRLEEARLRQQAGGNTVSETREEDDSSKRADLNSQRLKKPRQIYTLPKIIHSLDHREYSEEIGDNTGSSARENEFANKDSRKDDASNEINDNNFDGEKESKKSFATDMGCGFDQELSATLHYTKDEDFHGDETVLAKDLRRHVIPEVRNKSSHNFSNDSEEDKIVEEFTVL